MQEMKKCPHCGAIQQPSRQTCIDCGKVLPEAHPEFANELDRMADQKLEHKMEWNDPSSHIFRISRIFAILAAAVAIINIVLIVLYGNTHQVGVCFISIIACILAELMIFFPRQTSVILSRNRYRWQAYPPEECDYADSFERIGAFVITIILLLAAVGLTVYFRIEMPLIEPEWTYETILGEDGVGMHITHK